MLLRVILFVVIFFTCYAHRQENNYAAELESIQEMVPEDAREELLMNRLDDDLVERNMIEDSDGELDEEEADDDEIEDDRDPVIEGGFKETTGGAEDTKGKRPSTKQKDGNGQRTKKERKKKGRSKGTTGGAEYQGHEFHWIQGGLGGKN
ncbi:uncharacterized protein LOC135686309 isoform X1 [Rhopilema esculentum]|uniref:uncharacterized protein LOC135686309 isoform X1 n=1 Tax=Rhopilema esculentum TaxID=499914 RepID=UPI0031DBBE46